jgi:predicted  nucleic acid-binding Zn-ribbon protein
MLERLLYQVESHLLDLGRRLWPADPVAVVQREADRLERDLHEQCAALSRSQAERDEVRGRLGEKQNAVNRLPAQIRTLLAHGQTEEAWRAALALDEARQALAADRTALPRLEQVCWSLEFRIRQLERRLTALRRQLSSPEAT